MTIHIRSIVFNGDGSAVVEFVETDTDIKSNGLLINQTAFLPAEEYEDEIDVALDAARALTESLLADKTRLGPPEQAPVPEVDDDD